MPRSIRALAIAYYDSAAFKALNPITQGVYRNIIDRFCRETDRDGQAYGDKSAVTMKSKHVERLMEARADQARQRQRTAQGAARDDEGGDQAWDGATTIRPKA